MKLNLHRCINRPLLIEIRPVQGLTLSVSKATRLPTLIHGRHKNIPVPIPGRWFPIPPRWNHPGRVTAFFKELVNFIVAMTWFRPPPSIKPC